MLRATPASVFTHRRGNPNLVAIAKDWRNREVLGGGWSGLSFGFGVGLWGVLLVEVVVMVVVVQHMLRAGQGVI